ncbi:MAG: hypothetical protein ACYCST_21380 [Acidimicrobiales bacterium]
MTLQPVCLEAGDTVELGEMLGFLGQWLASERAVLRASLRRFVGTEGYDAEMLRADVLRFEFLLGTSDGESLFGDDGP